MYIYIYIYNYLSLSLSLHVHIIYIYIYIYMHIYIYIYRERERELSLSVSTKIFRVFARASCQVLPTGSKLNESEGRHGDSAPKVSKPTHRRPVMTWMLYRLVVCPYCKDASAYPGDSLWKKLAVRPLHALLPRCDVTTARAKRHDLSPPRAMR